MQKNPLPDGRFLQKFNLSAGFLKFGWDDNWLSRGLNLQKFSQQIDRRFQNFRPLNYLSLLSMIKLSVERNNTGPKA